MCLGAMLATKNRQTKQCQNQHKEIKQSAQEWSN